MIHKSPRGSILLENGEVIPYDDVDDIAVERACAGDPARPLTVAETAIAVAQLTRFGYSELEIARRCLVTPRTVARCRARQAAA